MSKNRAGWQVTGALALAGAAASAIALGIDGTGEAGIRGTIRVTARLGAVVFAVVFATSSLNALFRAGWSKWLLRHRRHLGLGFAVVHFVHLGFVFALGFMHTDSFWATTAMASIIGGGIGYVVLLAMVVTSLDSTAKAIGRRAWTILHKTGMYLMWLIFVYSYIARVFAAPIYTALVALLLAAWALRLAAFARKKIKRGADRRAGAERTA